MEFLHYKETVHGDLKPPNVLFDGAGRAKVRQNYHDLQDTMCHDSVYCMSVDYTLACNCFGRVGVSTFTKMNFACWMFLT